MVLVTMADSKRELGRRLKEARTASGLRQEQVAEAIGSHTVTVSKYERGIQDPNTELLREMATLYGVSVDSLLGRDAIYGDSEEDSEQSSIEADREMVMNEASLALRSTGKELSDEAIRSIADFIRFVHEKERRESQSGS